jgi:hypothetical protein
MFHAVSGGRYIIFGSVNNIAVDVCVLVAWAGVCFFIASVVSLAKLSKLLMKATPTEIAAAFEDLGQTSYSSAEAICVSRGQGRYSVELKESSASA